MTKLTLEKVVKQYGDFRAVDNISLEVEDGELVTLLGPSGCGKTTTLRCVTGFLVPEQGSIYIGNRNVTEIAPERRGIGLVFQNYALWPHMTVFKNIAFGLKLKKVHKTEIRKRVAEILSTVRLTGYEDRYPRELSGGQQQRVALARALVLQPDILLLDEPLSNLDAQLREQMRFELAQLQKQFAITTIYVTHDQTEAMAISDRIVLMNEGNIMQHGTPGEIYRNPTNRFAAAFMGSTSFMEGELTGSVNGHVKVHTSNGLELCGKQSGDLTGRNVCIMVRPEHIGLGAENNGHIKTGGQNVVKSEIARASFLGDTMDYELLVGDPPHRIRARGPLNETYNVGDTVYVRIDPDQVRVLSI